MKEREAKKPSVQKSEEAKIFLAQLGQLAKRKSMKLLLYPEVTAKLLDISTIFMLIIALKTYTNLIINFFQFMNGTTFVKAQHPTQNGK